MSNREISRRDITGELDLPAFETAILGEIEALGLPSENILVPIRQRVGVLNQMGDVLEPVDAAALVGSGCPARAGHRVGEPV